MNSSFWFFLNIFNVFQSITVITSKFFCPNCLILGHRTPLLQVGSCVLLARPQWSLVASVLFWHTVSLAHLVQVPALDLEAAISSRSLVNYLLRFLCFS